SALATLFVSQSKTRMELDKENRMIDNGRYALDLLSENLSMAGFYGEYDPSSLALPALPNDPCSNTASEIQESLRLHVQGYDASDLISEITSPPDCVAETIKDGSDILVIRRAQTTAIAEAGAVDNTTYLQVSLCTPTSGLNENSFILATAPSTYNLSTKTCTAANSGPSADLRRFLVQIYYIDSNNQPDDGIPTLKMAELSTNNTFVSTPLVEGIEYMQVDYGIDGVDTDADGIIDDNIDGVADGTYVSCSACSADQWSHVVSVKINIIARNLEPSKDYTDVKTYTLGTAGNVTPADSFRRHAYTQVIRLTNPAGRRE
ncbi:MAG TPA: PilW family protein, partial [Methylotenera sp.]|nr:PilW family protein [Methylotenera sp.]